MCAVDAAASNGSHGPHAWARPWTHLAIDRRTPSYCRITFDHPPVNAITATTVVELAELVELIEADADLNVVVFDSANPGFYLTPGAALSDKHAWIDLLVDLARAPVVSIASIRGRVSGPGSEFVLACDLRFVSRDNAMLGQPEVGAGGGPTGRLSRLVGSSRAVEMLLAGHDFDGRRAERYGYVNRAIADDALDREVDAIALRVAGFDHDVVARTKSHVSSGKR
jgi:enoyl-CoA hydratase/carnithine racemase